VGADVSLLLCRRRLFPLPASTPSWQSGLIEWYDSEDVADGTSDPVTSWPSRVNGHIAGNDTGSQQFTKNGSLWGSVRTVSTGTGGYVTWPKGPDLVTQDTNATVLFVGEHTSAADHQNCCSVGGLDAQAAHSQWLHYPATGDHYTWNKHQPGLIVESSQSYAGTTGTGKRLALAWWTGTAPNSTTMARSANSEWEEFVGWDSSQFGFGPTLNYRIGASAIGTFNAWIGNIRAFMTWGRRLSNAELAAVRAYYGVT
jgi:hypothetical protein